MGNMVPLTQLEQQQMDFMLSHSHHDNIHHKTIQIFMEKLWLDN